MVAAPEPSNLGPLYAKLASLDTALFFDSSGAATNAY
ncbi:ABC transporter substrate-binding protein, partial [Xylella fastidiosa subsp. multiplex]|nr:ABC transporter substrate-binding protein [Xylella fastidiosa subsp. multiplex]